MASIYKNKILLYLGLAFGERDSYFVVLSFDKISFLYILISIFPKFVIGSNLRIISGFLSSFNFLNSESSKEITSAITLLKNLSKWL